MKGINFGRWIGGGLAAGVFLLIMEGLASTLYMADMQAAMAAHNLAMEMNAGVVVITIMVSMISGLTLVFFYAASRPRFGSGPKTAVIVAVGLWIGGYLLTLMGYQRVGLYPQTMLLAWGTVGLVEMILASLLGAWIYREN